MTLRTPCKFYEDSKCILKGRYCDLNCNRLFNDEDFDSYDKTDSLNKWRMKEGEKEMKNSGWRWR